MKHEYFPYKKDSGHSFAPGAFATFELLKKRPDLARAVYLRENFADESGLCRLCESSGVPVFYGDGHFNRAGQKENVYALGVFEKPKPSLSPKGPHVVLDCPAEFGNLGTIIRTAAALGFFDIGVIQPAADVFHPKTVRASMGAIFSANIKRHPSFEGYLSEHSGMNVYLFMTDGETDLREITSAEAPYALAFGNEARGLDPSLRRFGKSVRIPQGEGVDSYNLAVAFGIAAFKFAPLR